MAAKKAAAKKSTPTKGQKAESARMAKQAERGVGISAKKSERNAITKKADQVFGKGNYNLISGTRTKVPVSNSKQSYGYAGSGQLTAVPKGVGSVGNAQTRITASTSPSARIYNPFRTETITVVSKQKDAKFKATTSNKKNKK
jgi:hypothetical protein